MFHRLKLSVAVLALMAGAAAAKDSVTIGMQLEPPNLDPTSGAAAAIREVTQINIYEGLTRFNADGSIGPGLAASWDVTEGGKVWTFNLREGVKFHDGTTFDANDVKFTLDRAMAPDSTNAQKQLFAPIESVDVVDAKTVKITLKAPSGNFGFNMAWGDASIMAPESVATNATNPVGTGPYRLGQWVQGDRIELVANPDYWGEKPGIPKAVFKVIADPTAAFAAMMSEDIDVFPVFPAPETPRTTVTPQSGISAEKFCNTACPPNDFVMCCNTILSSIAANPPHAPHQEPLQQHRKRYNHQRPGK